MSELKELIATPVGHDEPNGDCPFCPPPDADDYKTYPGSANNSTKLIAIMETPAALLTEQKGARPQNARIDEDGWDQEQQTPDPRTKDEKKWYTFQAHHLISGKQALEGESMEEWILASDRNEKPTGYSINCTGNGFWAPSVPKEYVGKWSAKKNVIDDAKRQQLAEAIMEDAVAQIHIGPHNISDPDDPDGDKHTSYDNYVKLRLKELDDRIVAWRTHCYLCKPQDKKPQASHHVHDLLDTLSDHLEEKVSGNRVSWDIFLSKYALDYHTPVCAHTGRKKR